MKITVWLSLVLMCIINTAVAQPNSRDLEFVESGLTLRLSSPVQVDGSRKPVLHMETNDVYECANTTLEYDAVVDGRRMFIKVKGIRVPEPCTPAMGRAATRVDLSKMELGTYDVTITINRQVFKAYLEITDTYLEFGIPNENPILLRIINPRLNLIPAQSIWGVSSYTSPERKADALTFMRELEARGATLTQLAVGDYEDFYLHNTGRTEEKMVRADLYEYPFVYHYTGDIRALEALINAYKGKLNITLKDSRGVQIQNF